MDSLWRDVHRLCDDVFDASDARRAANLALAAIHVAAFRKTSPTKELVMSIACEFNDVAALAALMPPSVLAAGVGRADPLTPENLDAWVEAFQASGHDRKTAGAYATPSAFADVLARGALDGSIVGIPRILDPSAGAGNLLLAAYRSLRARGCEAQDAVLALHGVELDPAARELCVLLLWLTSGASVSLSNIANRIVVDNALTRDWWRGESFDVVLMNPPWESLRPQKGEAWDEQRVATIERLTATSPGAIDLPALYTAQGRGDRNLFKAFVELAPHLLREGGRLGALVPAAFGSDLGMAVLRARYLDQFRLERWSTFENRQKHFTIDSRYKFGLLFGSRHPEGTTSLQVRAFCERPEEVGAAHVLLSRKDIATIGGPNNMIPELTSDCERKILAAILTRGTPLFEPGPLGCVRYKRELDLTLHKAAGTFWRTDDKPPVRLPPGTKAVPLLEGRMVGQYDCFQKSYVGGEGRRAVWEDNAARPIEACRSQYVVAPTLAPARLALCDVTSATNTRTVLATLVPETWRCGNTAPVLQFERPSFATAGLAILNSMTFDWMARRLLGGLHLNRFYLEQFVWPALSPTEVSELGTLARVILHATPRGGQQRAKKEPVDSGKRLRALARIEVIVARAYGIGAAELSTMFTVDRTDRRGFWRFYASSPDALLVVEQALTELKRPSGTQVKSIAA